VPAVFPRDDRKREKSPISWFPGLPVYSCAADLTHWFHATDSAPVDEFFSIGARGMVFETHAIRQERVKPISQSVLVCFRVSSFTGRALEPLQSGSLPRACTPRYGYNSEQSATLFLTVPKWPSPSHPDGSMYLFFSGILLLFFLSLQSLPRWAPESLPIVQEEYASSAVDNLGTQQDGNRPLVEALPLAPEYNIASPSWVSEPHSRFCKARFSTKFLEDFRDRRAGYCSQSLTSDLTCFHTVDSGSFAPSSLDPFCLAQTGISFDIQRQKFAFDCQIRDLTDQETALGAAPSQEL
jgi:hypothetical protein